MKYGKTERISGLVILLALLAIFVPWLMSDPAPREERPQPSFVIEEPIRVERTDVATPERPSTIDLGQGEDRQIDTGGLTSPIEAMPREPQTDNVPNTSSGNGTQAPARDPIAAIATSSETATAGNTGSNSASSSSSSTSSSSNSNSSSSSSSSSGSSGPAASAQGEWAVQVGSFGEPANAERLGEQLRQSGFTVFTRQRDNNMTTVLVGPYASSDAGEQAMASIKQQANVQGLLVRVRD